MNTNEEYMLDLGIRNNNIYFFTLLIYLNEKGYEKENIICDELCIPKNELHEFINFQRDIGYIESIPNENNILVYYLTERGLRAYNNLVDDRDRERIANNTYIIYTKTHPIKEETTFVEMRKQKIFRKSFRNV